jgi:Carboxypeptidase regulatory-like domain
MKKLVILFALLAVAVIVGCDLGVGSGDVPAQTYVNGLTAVVSATGEVRGQILFPSEYAQHSIRFALDQVTFVTHPDGRFRITNVPTGEHRLVVRVKGYEPVATPLRVANGKQLALDPLRLVEARGRVLGRLVQDKGSSAEGVEVRLAPEDGVAYTDSDGIFQFLGVTAGEHTLMVKDSRYFAGNQHFTLSNNERRNLGNIRVYLQTRGDPRTARLQN